MKNARGANTDGRREAKRIRAHLDFLYGAQTGGRVFPRLMRLLEQTRPRLTRPPQASREAPLPLDQRDAILITYGDQFRGPGEKPLTTLGSFLRRHLRGLVSGVHILPFFPYSSDDGFSVIDFRAVNSEWGSWDDLQAAGAGFRLMFDLVLNHVSARSEWFRAFLRDQKPYRDYFIVVPEEADLSAVFRPRALPLLTPVQTPSGRKLVWTTFSADQVDLDYRNPEVLLEMIGVLLLYLEKGTQLIRLDAVAYLWKQFGTSCIHLPQTHRVVQLLRSVLDVVAPWVMIITETNVPHRENVSYFGDGGNEAQLVYQFSLPPLVLDAFRRGDAGHLRSWAADLGEPPGAVAFFNFLASHDGTGLLPARGILTEEELAGLEELTLSRGGRVSYKSTPAGRVPYELNISFFDAVAAPGEEPELQVRKFLCTQAIMLAFRGLPGIYVHSLLGTPNYTAKVEETGVNRAINRRRYALGEIEAILEDPMSLESRVFRGYRELLALRRSVPAFHPFGPQELLDGSGAVLAFRRSSPDGAQAVLCAFNTSGRESLLSVPAPAAKGGARRPEAEKVPRDLTAGTLVAPRAGAPRRRDGRLEVPLGPYEFRWLAW